MRIFSCGTSLIALSMLAACGGAEADRTAADGDPPTAQGGSAETSAARNTDPCSFITADEVATITTNKVVRTARDKTDCTYHSLPDEKLTLTIHDGDGEKRMETVRRTHGLLQGIGKEVAKEGPVGGDVNAMLQADGSEAPALGDDAIWGLNGTLSVRKGDLFVEVMPPIMHDPATHPGIPLIKQSERRLISQRVIEKVLAKAAQ